MKQWIWPCALLAGILGWNTMQSTPDTPDEATIEKAEKLPQQSMKATFGGGCFWCTEAMLEDLEGVSSVVSGYTAGHVKDPTYRQVCEGTTGHAEVVQVTFDPEKISYQRLLDLFWRSHHAAFEPVCELNLLHRHHHARDQVGVAIDEDTPFDATLTSGSQALECETPRFCTPLALRRAWLGSPSESAVET